MLFIKFIFSFIKPIDLFKSYKEIYYARLNEFELEDTDILREKYAVTQAEKDKSFSVTIISTMFLAVIDKTGIVKDDTLAFVFLSILIFILSICTKSIVISSLKNSAVRDILAQRNGNMDSPVITKGDNNLDNNLRKDSQDKEDISHKKEPNQNRDKRKFKRDYIFIALASVSILALYFGIDILSSLKDKIFSFNYKDLKGDWLLLFCSLLGLYCDNLKKILGKMISVIKR